SMVIGDLALWEKTGGRSGHWRRPANTLAEPLVNTPETPEAAEPRPRGLDADIDDLIGDDDHRPR
ncbi:MAG: hypothetical protein ACRD0H_09290, partial [Actinomycetes bacterium]